MRESFIFYKSFYESIKELDEKDKLLVYDAICEYCINNKEIEHTIISKAIFTLIKPQLDANNKSNFKEISKYHWNWKGGISDENKILRNSSQMIEWRIKVFERDNYTCQSCGQIGNELQVHHIIPFSLDKTKIFDIDNGKTLCKKCHLELHKNERLWL